MHFLLKGSWEHTIIILELTKASLNKIYIREGEHERITLKEEGRKEGWGLAADYNLGLFFDILKLG